MGYQIDVDDRLVMRRSSIDLSRLAVQLDSMKVQRFRPSTKPGMHRRHLPRERVPTARLPEHGLRENLDYETPKSGHGIVTGERLATDKRHPGYTVLESAPSMPLLLPRHGEGESAFSTSSIVR